MPSTEHEFRQKKFDYNVSREGKVQKQLQIDIWNVPIVRKC